MGISGRKRFFGAILVAAALSPVPASARGVTQEDCQRAIQATEDAYGAGTEPDEGTLAMAKACATPVREELIVTDVRSTGARLRGTSCKTIHVGYGYVNGFGQIITALYGHLNWCYNGNKVQGGDFWTTEDHCCWWFWEGIVSANNQGCFGGCPYVYRYRLGSWIFNPPWPQTTTRAQIWVAMAGDKNGSWWKNAGD